MDIVALVALVVTITQVVKQVIRVDPNIIAVVVSVLVVAYKAVESGTPITIGLLVVLVQVIFGAIGSFKVAKQVLSPGK
mgnify:FL=1|jgi:hypothetical protein